MKNQLLYGVMELYDSRNVPANKLPFTIVKLPSFLKSKNFSSSRTKSLFGGREHATNFSDEKSLTIKNTRVALKKCDPYKIGPKA